jgi:uncharacterized protein YbbK (DUF523 family)/uncharacterized protein YbgA (DUF1722 family)
MTRCVQPVFPRPLLGVSACLLGEPVRYDGGHKRHAFVADLLTAHVDCVPLCPEAAIGMGVPRPPIQLVGERGRPRALGVQDPSLDVTARLEQFATRCTADLRHVSGYLFKKDSPSCGLRGVKLLAYPGGPARRRGTGLFAAAVQAARPLLPVEQEDALDDPRRRDSFITRLYVYRRWQMLCDSGLSSAALRDFHSAHAHLVMAHSRAAWRRLTQRLASAAVGPLDEVADDYLRELLIALARPATRAGHYAVLQDLAQRCASQLNNKRQAALQARLQAYREGGLSLGDAVAALRALSERCGQQPVAGQTYLYPYPDALQLHKI